MRRAEAHRGVVQALLERDGVVGVVDPHREAADAIERLERDAATVPSSTSTRAAPCAP